MRDESRPGASALPRRALGLVLLVTACSPVFLLVDHPGTGVPGAQAVTLSWTFLESTVWGGIVAMGIGTVFAILVPAVPLRNLVKRTAKRLRSPSPWRFALGVGILSGLLTAVASRSLFAGQPTLEDGMALLVHARYVAAGSLAGTLPDPVAAWLIPNTLLTAEGWISQYPPLHVLILAAGHLLGAVWLVGPLLVAVTVVFTARVGELVLGPSSATARGGAVLTAVSPFLLYLGAGYLSHVSAAAFTAFVLYAAVRSSESEAWWWPTLTGIGAGAVVATRPWTGLFLGVLLPAGLWIVPRRRKGRKAPSILRRLGYATLGGLPIAVALGFYNFRFFGHPLRFGYTSAYGSAHLPGFHLDPWGHVYGVREALGYTSADLLALGAHLLESPLPVVVLVALALILVSDLPRGTGVFLAWALLPVAANALYWHHGYHFGPRMLFEAAPAWCLLVMISAIALVGRSTNPEESGKTSLSRLLRNSLLWAIALTIPATGYLAIERGLGYAWPEETLARIVAPRSPTDDPALVFVHGSWSERVAGHLRQSGMGADSVEILLRRNDLCAVQRYASMRTEEAEVASVGGALDLRNLPGTPPILELIETAGGYLVRRNPTLQWNEECMRQLTSDRLGVISLAPLLWQGDLPGVEEGRPLFVRDLGPEENAALLAQWPNRRPRVWLPGGDEEGPRMRVYSEAMRLLW